MGRRLRVPVRPVLALVGMTLGDWLETEPRLTPPFRMSDNPRRNRQMERDWLDIVDDGVEDDESPNPTRRDGTFRLYEFSGDASYLPTLLEQVASWARECAEYQIVDLSVSDRSEERRGGKGGVSTVQIGGPPDH